MGNHSGRARSRGARAARAASGGGTSSARARQDLRDANAAIPGAPSAKTGRMLAGGPRTTARPPAAATAKAPSSATEGMHERSARLQREGGLQAEVRPGEHIQVEHYIEPKRFGPDVHGERMVSALKEAYGEHQLGAVLARYPFSELRLAAKDYGIKPGTSKDEALSRITAHVTEGRYSANFGGAKGEGGTKSAGSRSGGTRSRSAAKSEAARPTTGKSAREQQLERQVASLRAERDALRAQAASGTTRARAAGGSTKAGGARRAATPLTPEHYVDAKLFGPDKSPNPYLLHYIYGARQFHAALDRYPASELKKASALVEQRNPGTKPSNRSQKAALLAYIEQHVTAGEAPGS